VLCSLVTDSILLLVIIIVCSNFLFLPDLVLSDCMWYEQVLGGSWLKAYGPVFSFVQKPPPSFSWGD